ncbi:hypothetical protein QVD17_08998 [Tagetes erecta]|uniref:Uncharacterized protein n=1 Tax=Tagetes erecta TaxID=13708 RepID=A0AAD8P4U2_TARER|nr:hypothetical protein QVD17_08998 [Tagetes erecta]
MQHSDKSGAGKTSTRETNLKEGHLSCKKKTAAEENLGSSNEHTPEQVSTHSNMEDDFDDLTFVAMAIEKVDKVEERYNLSKLIEKEMPSFSLQLTQLEKDEDNNQPEKDIDHIPLAERLDNVLYKTPEVRCKRKITKSREFRSPYVNRVVDISQRFSVEEEKIWKYLFSSNEDEKLRQLKPNNATDVISLSWMKSALGSICETLDDIRKLIVDLELPICSWDIKWVDMYLDNNLKLLDFCNAYGTDIVRQRFGYVMLKCALLDLESGNPQKLMLTSSSLHEWMQYQRRYDNQANLFDA